MQRSKRIRKDRITFGNQRTQDRETVRGGNCKKTEKSEKMREERPEETMGQSLSSSGAL